MLHYKRNKTTSQRPAERYIVSLGTESEVLSKEQLQLLLESYGLYLRQHSNFFEIISGEGEIELEYRAV